MSYVCLPLPSWMAQSVGRLGYEINNYGFMVRLVARLRVFSSNKNLSGLLDPLSSYLMETGESSWGIKAARE
jgi:hypothetical protein